MVTFNLTKPSNSIVLSPGDAPITAFFATGAGTVKPGFFVKKGADDNKVVITAAATDSAIGLVGYEKAGYFMPSTITTAYNSGDIVPVHAGGGFLALVWHDTSSETVNMGDNLGLSAATAGGVCKAAALAIAAGGTSVTSSAANGASDITGAATPSQVVAQAMETVSFSGTAGWLLAKIFI